MGTKEDRVGTIELAAEDETKVVEFAGRLFEACLGTMELANVELGVRLGLYEDMSCVVRLG